MKKKKNKGNYLNRMMTAFSRIPKTINNAFKKEEQAVKKMDDRQRFDYYLERNKGMFYGGRM